MTLKKKNKMKAWIGTLLFHALLILLFLFTGPSYTIPPPPEEGISINFGTTDFGEGEIEEITEPTEESNPENLSENNPVTEEINSQETKETIEVKKEKETKENNSENTEIETEEITKEEKKEINKKAIFNPNKKKGNEGNTSGDGNMGEVDGDPNSDNYTGGGFGDGLSPIGTYRSIPKDFDHPLEMGEGYITIDVIVNLEGKIINIDDGSFYSTLGYIGKTKREKLYKSIKKDLKYGPATGDNKSDKVAKLKIFFKY